MPLYEYQCKTCGERFEKMVKFSDTFLQPECPYCHSLETEKQISRIASSSSEGSSSASGGSCSSSGRFT